VTDDGEYVTFNKNGLLELVGTVDLFEMNFLILTHFFITFYVGINAIVAIKIVYITLYGYFLMACLNLIYSGPRPYWTSDNISSPVCLKSYAFPCRDVFIGLFLIFYSTYCYRTKV
jgi:hypothetical protein